MADQGDRRDARTSDSTVTLSTGEPVPLPFPYACDLAGAVFSGDWRRLREVVPAGVTPIRVAPGRGLVVLSGVSYHEAGGFAPYEEFAVVVPVARRTVDGVPLRGAEIGGSVLALPVTSDASRRLGREVWGYPKTVADVDFERTRRAFRTTVRDAGGEVVLRVEKGATHPVETSLDSYARKDDQLYRSTVELDGLLGVGFGGEHATLASDADTGDGGSGVGDDAATPQGPERDASLAATLDRLDLGERALFRFFGARVTGRIHAAEPV